MIDRPLVSVIIPVYNGADYIGEAIESALKQTYNNIEILVINDGSCDDGATDRAVSRYADRVRYIKKENGGVSSALNLGIVEMRGEFFSWLSHDDLYVHEKIEKEIDALSDKNEIALCSGGLIGEKGEKLPYKIKSYHGKYSGLELFDLFLDGYILNGLGFLVPKAVFDDCGYFDEHMRYLQDLDMWMRIMIKNYTFVLLEEKLVMTRIHKGQVSNTSAHLFVAEKKILAKKYMDIIQSVPDDSRKDVLLRYYCLYTKDKNMDGLRYTNQIIDEYGYSKSEFTRKALKYSFVSILKSVKSKVVNLYLKITGRRK